MVCASGVWLSSWARFLSGNRLAPFVPTSPEVAARMLTLARLSPGERLCDLGCGDGRLLMMAVRQCGAARATGYELDSTLAAMAEAAAATDRRVVVRRADAMGSAADLADADVVTLYLSDSGNAALLPLLRAALRPGARVVSNVWEMPPAVQAKATTIIMPGSGVPLHLYEAPLG